jgi:hypothetical protein
MRYQRSLIAGIREWRDFCTVCVCVSVLVICVQNKKRFRIFEELFDSLIHGNADFIQIPKIW